MASVGVGEVTAVKVEYGVEAGDEHVGWDVSEQGIVDPSQYIPGEEEPKAWATALSMVRALAITSAAGTPLPVASPTTTPSLPSERR